MATILRVNKIPVEGKFSFETHDGKKYTGPLDKKDLIIKWIISQHKNIPAMPRHVYESLDEYFISPVLFLPKDVLTNVAHYIETPRLQNYMDKTKTTYLFEKDKERLDTFKLEDEEQKFYIYGKRGDVDSFIETVPREVYKSCEVNGEIDYERYEQWVENIKMFVKGMLETKRYHQLYLLIMNEFPEDLDIAMDDEEDPHSLVVDVLFHIKGLRQNYNIYPGRPGVKHLDAMFDFNMSNEDIIEFMFMTDVILDNEINVDNKLIDHILTKKPDFVYPLFNKIIKLNLTGPIKETDQIIEQYYELVKKYKHLIDISKLEMPSYVLEYGANRGKFNTLRSFNKDMVSVTVGDIFGPKMKLT